MVLYIKYECVSSEFTTSKLATTCQVKLIAPKFSQNVLFLRFGGGVALTHERKVRNK